MRLGAVDRRRRAHRRRPADARAAGLAAPRAHAARGRAAAGAGAAGALLAALAGERDILLGSRAFGGSTPSIARPGRVGPAAARRPLRGGRAARLLRRRLPRARARSARRARRRARAASARARRAAARTSLPTALLRCVLAGFPDRVVPPPRAGLRPCGHGGRHRRRARRRRASCARPSCSSPSTSRAAGGGPTPWCGSRAPCGASGSRRSSRARSRPR